MDCSRATSAPLPGITCTELRAASLDYPGPWAHARVELILYRLNVVSGSCCCICADHTVIPWVAAQIVSVDSLCKFGALIPAGGMM